MKPGAFFVALTALLLSGGAAELEAAEARLERVVLLPSIDRFSIAFEMSAEPEKVVTHDLSETTLEIEIGPVAGGVAPRELRPTGGVDQVRDVVIREFDAGDGSLFLRARITLRRPAGSHVRIVDRRVYVDFAGAEASPATEPPATAPRESPRAPAGEAAGYAEAVQPAVTRLAEIEPFLLSAAGSPTPPVLSAIAGSLEDVYQSLQSVNVPAAAVSTHGRLTTAVLTARRAVEPAFGGDRLAEAHKAMALLEATKAEIPNGGAR